MRAHASWVRVRLRAAPGPALALALLALVTSFLAAAFPRAVDAYEGEGLRHEMRSAPPHRGGIELSAPAAPPDGDGVLAEPLDAARLAAHHRRILAVLPAPLRADTAQSAHGVRTTEPVAATDDWLPRLEGGPTVFTLAAHADLARHARIRSGRLPTAADGAVTPTTPAVEAAVTTATARALGIRAGATVHVPKGLGGTLTVTVTGIVDPVRPDLSYWSYEPVLRTPARLFTPPPVVEPYWHGALLLPVGAAPVLPSVAPRAEAYWRVATDPDDLRAGDRDGLRKAVASLESGPLLAGLGTPDVPESYATSGLDDLLADHDRFTAAVGPVVAVAALGVGTVAGVVLVMAGGLAAAHRRAELSLLRARGASVRGLAGLLFAETAVPVLPAAALGCAAAFLLVPEGRPLPALAAAAAVALVACAALPLHAARLHRRPQPAGGREDPAPARSSRRRTVAELTLLVLAAAAVAALRRRGTGTGGTDALVAAAPVLVGLIAALLLVRLHPLPLRLAARPAARGRGAVGFLALARAGRAPALTALPLLALVVALATAAFGGSVLAGVDGARDAAALAAVGADARVDAEALPAAVTDAVRRAPGVEDVAAVHRAHDLDVGEGGAEGVTLLAVDPDSYARLARRTGLGAFAADRLRAGSGPLPALVSPGVAARLGTGQVDVGPPDGRFTVRVALVRDSTPGHAVRGDFLVVDASRLPGDRHRTPTTLLVTGASTSATALRSAARTADGGATVTLRSAERARLTDSPVQRGAEQVHILAAAAAAGYAVLAVLLSLLRAAPERTALLARLRTMGLTRRQGRGMLVRESLPPALLAAAGGALAGWAAIRLLAAGLDLGPLALGAAQGRHGPPESVPLRADAWSLLLPAAAVLVLTAGAAAVQAWAATRRSTTTDLRAGDAR